jgi:hypothetical protein
MMVKPIILCRACAASLAAALLGSMSRRIKTAANLRRGEKQIVIVFLLSCTGCI